MTVVKINAITITPGTDEEIVHRFAARAHAVDDQPGFQGFELLRPEDETHPWLVVTRWDDQASFDAWQHSQNFAHHAHGSNTGEHSVVTRAELRGYVPVVDNH